MNGLVRGGAQTFIINNVPALYEKGIICDFLVRRSDGVYSDLIQQYYGKIIVTASFPRHFLHNYIQTEKFFEQHGFEYSAVHVHANALLYVLPLILAKRVGIPIRIIHSHNTKTNIPYLKFLHELNKKRVSKWANVFLACGQDAGHWMFDNKHFNVINNCIDEQLFRYSEFNRKMVRNRYKVPDDYLLIGHVGAFRPQKNHVFLLNVYKEYLNMNRKTKLILLGTGIIENEIRELSKSLGLEDDVVFAGSQDNIHQYYHAMDVFLFPSLFEGLPFALIEAQMSGLKIIASDQITDECIKTDLVQKMSLNSSYVNWANMIELISNRAVRREKYARIVSDAGYGIRYSSEKLYEIYNNALL